MTRTPCIDGTLAHHTVFGSPDGPTSTGVCKRCGLEATARNSEPDTATYYNNSRVTDTVRNRANAAQKGTWARKKAGMARAMSQTGGTE